MEWLIYWLFLVVLAFWMLNRREHHHWDHKFDVLAEYNALKARAAGTMWDTRSGVPREEQKRQAQEELDALTPEFKLRMLELQAEWNVRDAHR